MCLGRPREIGQGIPEGILRETLEFRLVNFPLSRFGFFSPPSEAMFEKKIPTQYEDFYYNIESSPGCKKDFSPVPVFKAIAPLHWLALFGPFLESIYDKFETKLMDGIVEKHLPNSPSYSKLQLQVGGFMMNSISEFVFPRKFPRNFEFVGGMHIEEGNSQAIPQVCNPCNCISD